MVIYHTLLILMLMLWSSLSCRGFLLVYRSLLAEMRLKVNLLLDVVFSDVQPPNLNGIMAQLGF